MDNIPYKLRQLHQQGIPNASHQWAPLIKVFTFKNIYEIYQSLHKIFSWTGPPRQGRSLPFTQFFENRQKCIRRILSCTHWLLATPWKVCFFRKETTITLRNFCYIKIFWGALFCPLMSTTNWCGRMIQFDLIIWSTVILQSVKPTFLSIRCRSNL